MKFKQQAIMETTTVDLLLVMRISCPGCGKEGTVKKQMPPLEDFAVLCPRCKEEVLLKVNRRNHYRKSALIPVGYSLDDIDRPDDQRARAGRIINISRQGIGVRCYGHHFSPLYYREGNLFTFLFSLPLINGLKKVQGEVMRISEIDEDSTFAIGVRFSDLHHFTNNAIRSFLFSSL
jgi:c-di-GMP-binding flagellar brake protein YcgR